MAVYITQIKNSITKPDIKKTKQLLVELKQHSLKTKIKVLEILALAPDLTALNLIPVLIQRENIDEEIYDRTIQLLTDRAHLNFNFSLILYKECDKNGILQIAPLMKHILSKGTDFEVLRETLRTAGINKIESLEDDIAEFIFYDELKLKAEAIRALEMIGSGKAHANLLKASNSSKCDQDILNALETFKNKTLTKNLLTDHQELNKGLQSKDIKIRFTSFSKLVNLGNQASEPLAANIQSEDNDLIISSLNIISRIIPKKLISKILPLIEGKKGSKDVKLAAYLALGAFPESDSTIHALAGINESNASLRIAAIKILDKNPSDLIIAEIKEKIESGTESGKQLGESILDAHANNLIANLMVSDAFSYIASNYLEKKAPFQVRENFINIQKKRNLNASTKKYKKILARRRKQEKERPCVIIISSSPTRINIYIKILFSAGYSISPFSSPQSAFESIMTNKPFAVMCDLFLNNITGLDFLEEIRDIHPESELPVIFSTLQQDFLGGDKNIIAFPPNSDQINACLGHYQAA